MTGGYDELYMSSPCAWGKSPGSLVTKFVSGLSTLEGMRVLDAGCGEGKNSIYLARLGAQVDAFDESALALKNAKDAWPDYNAVSWTCCGTDKWDWKQEEYDIVIAYGLLHCLKSDWDAIRLLDLMKAATRRGGTILICAFNDRFQQLHAHRELEPLLLPHTFYCAAFDNWEIQHCTDSDLWEVHPHDPSRHCHSMSRIIARKPD